MPTSARHRKYEQLTKTQFEKKTNENKKSEKNNAIVCGVSEYQQSIVERICGTGVF